MLWDVTVELWLANFPCVPISEYNLSKYVFMALYQPELDSLIFNIPLEIILIRTRLPERHGNGVQ